MTDMRCPCRKKTETTAYADCCQPYHAGTTFAPTAEILMRSRYAAFVLRKTDYILNTWHPSRRPKFIPVDKTETWLSLKIHGGTTTGDDATVEFTARSLIKGQAQVMHEVSRFVRVGGRWFYVRDDGAAAGTPRAT